MKKIVIFDERKYLSRYIKDNFIKDFQIERYSSFDKEKVNGANLILFMHYFDIDHSVYEHFFSSKLPVIFLVKNKTDTLFFSKYDTQVFDISNLLKKDVFKLLNSYFLKL